MNIVDASVENLALPSWLWLAPHTDSPGNAAPATLTPPPRQTWDIFAPLRHWLEHLNISNAYFAHRLCQLIPAQCPFELDVLFFGHLLFHIPPMCKLNPLYYDLMMLRFRALCYLVDECGEDVSRYLKSGSKAPSF